MSNKNNKQYERSSVVDVVARIKKTTPQLYNLRQAQGSLFDALQRIPDDPLFDLQQWNADWQQAEAELRAKN